MARRDRIVMVKRQNPKRVTLPNGRTFYAYTNEQLELTYLQMYVLNNLIDKELLQEVEGDVSDKVGEVLRVLLKKYSILVRKSVKTKLSEILVKR